MKNKKAILDNLYYNIGNQEYDFFVCGTFINKEGEKCFTKWKSYSEAIFPIDFNGYCDDWKTQKFFEQINQRQILPNELVLDIEERENIKNIILRLKAKKLNNFEVWDTGSRGYHIHIFSKKQISTKTKEKLIKYFGTDILKSGEKNMIALEDCPHWKTGNIKRKVII